MLIANSLQHCLEILPKSVVCLTVCVEHMRLKILFELVLAEIRVAVAQKLYRLDHQIKSFLIDSEFQLIIRQEVM